MPRWKKQSCFLLRHAWVLPRQGLPAPHRTILSRVIDGSDAAYSAASCGADGRDPWSVGVIFTPVTPPQNRRPVCSGSGKTSRLRSLLNPLL
jgi:hypothetical protein